MVIGYGDVGGVLASPTETYAPLIVNADGVLPGTVSFEQFQPVRWWNSQVFKPGGTLQQDEFLQRTGLNVGWKTTGAFSFPQSSGLAACKRFNHSPQVYGNL